MPSVLLEPFEDMAPLKHRMEFLGAKNGIRVINNSMCTNPDAVVKSAQSVRDSVHLLLGGVNKGLSFKPVKAFLANQRHRGYLFGRDAAEINAELGGEIPIFGTMQEAFAAATAAAISGEVIMLAPGCASSDQFRDFRHRGDVFTELAKEWLDHEN
jgi:UDP-N-acetylmuramoylalanine--D-glutamate ligase